MVKVYEAGEVYSDGKTPVPSYDEYRELVFKANIPKNPVGDTIMCYDTERERAVVEHLQEQLKEANEVIKSCEWTYDGNKYQLCKLAYSYLKKYGLERLELETYEGQGVSHIALKSGV